MDLAAGTRAQPPAESALRRAARYAVAARLVRIYEVFPLITRPTIDNILLNPGVPTAPPRIAPRPRPAAEGMDGRERGNGGRLVFGLHRLPL